jgi:hypothetical protein
VVNFSQVNRLAKRVLGVRGIPSLGAGLLLGIAFVGIRNVNPLNISWLLSGNDATSHQLSFEFFRAAPLIQWPPTATPGLLSGSGQVLASANGLFGIPAKIIGLVVQERFQFYGIWLCLLFGLQGFFAERLLSIFIPHRLIAFSGSALYLIAPAFVFRIGLSHYELAAHFLILWGLYLIASNKGGARAWSFLLVTTMLVSIYMWTMLVVLFFAHHTLRFLRNSRLFNARNVVGQVVFPLVASAAGFFFMGYASYSENATGSGVFRANLLTFVNPISEGGLTMSPITTLLSPLGERNLTSQEVEGFNFLGLGPLVLLIVLMVMIVLKRRVEMVLHPIVFISAGSLFLYSLTNSVVIARRETTVWWPSPLVSLLEIFRSAARFSWPLYYVLITTAIVGCFRLLKPQVFKPMIFIVLAIATIDSRNLFSHAQTETFAEPTSTQVFVDEKWASVAVGRRSIELVPTFDLLTDGLSGELDQYRNLWDELENFAVSNGLSTNFGFVPRSVERYAKDRNAQNELELQSGRLDPDKIYLVLDSERWARYEQDLGSRAAAITLDGMNLIFSTK